MSTWLYYAITVANALTSWPVLLRVGKGGAAYGAVALLIALTAPFFLEEKTAVFLGLLMNFGVLS